MLKILAESPKKILRKAQFSTANLLALATDWMAYGKTLVRLRFAVWGALYLACGWAMATPVCYVPGNPNMQPGGVGVTASIGCGRPIDTGVSGFSMLGMTLNGNGSNCTLTFALPVRNVTVDIGAHSCDSDFNTCAEAQFEINGQYRAIASAELTPKTDYSFYPQALDPTVTYDPVSPLTIHNGNVLGGTDPVTTGNGSGQVEFPSTLPVQSIKITNALVYGYPDASFFNVCYDGLAPTAVTGKVILDTGKGTSGIAHNATQDGTEPGHSGVPVSLTDCSNTVYSSATTAADGSFSLSLAAVPAGGAVCVVELPPVGYRAVSGSGNGITGATLIGATNILKFTPIAGVEYSGIVLGNAPVSTLTSDGVQQGIAGQAVVYAHVYTAGSAGSVSFSSADNPSPAGFLWTSALYRDTNCNGTLDAADTLLTAPVTVTAGQQVCLLDKVATPAGAPNGAKDITTLTATEIWSVSTLTPASQSRALTNTDITTVGASGFTLLKEVRKLAYCPIDVAGSVGNTTTLYSTVGSSAAPGDALEYRLTYTNNTAAPLSSVKLNDAVPAFTQFKSALCLSLPAQGVSSCSITKPALDATSGAIVWTMTDASTAPKGLQPLDSGTVSFCVQVQNN